MKITDKIRNHFALLFETYGFRPYSETHFPAFANWEAIFQSSDCWLKFYQDRGYIAISLAIRSSDENEDGREWFSVESIIAYLRADEAYPDRVELVFNDVEQQLSALAIEYEQFAGAIHGLFQVDTFELNKVHLRTAQQQWQRDQWHRLYAGTKECREQ